MAGDDRPPATDAPVSAERSAVHLEGRQGGVVGLQEALLFVRQSYLAIEVEALLVSYGSKRLPRCPPAVTSRE